MLKFKTFVGIDISKKTFDATLLSPDSAVVNHQCFNQEIKRSFESGYFITIIFERGNIRWTATSFKEFIA